MMEPSEIIKRLSIENDTNSLIINIALQNNKMVEWIYNDIKDDIHGLCPAFDQHCKEHQCSDNRYKEECKKSLTKYFQKP